MTHARRPHVQGRHRNGKHLARHQHTSLRLETLETRELLSANVVENGFQANNLAAVTRTFQDGVQAYTGTQDARIVSTVPTDADYGGATRLRTDGTPDQAILLKWDLNDVPAGSKIQSAALSLNVTDPSRDSYELYALKRDWQEGSSTWQSTGMGSNWQVAGARGSQDRDSKVLGTIKTNAKGIATIELNADGIAQVQSWIDNPSSNHGFIIQDYDADDGLEFSSSENATVSVRPKLTLTYASSDSTTPPPGGSTNQAPVVDAGSDQTILPAQKANLKGSVTDDGQPGAMTTTWSMVSGPGTVTFSNASALETTAQFSKSGTYVLQLTANDGAISASDQLTVNVGVQGGSVVKSFQNGSDYSGAQDTRLRASYPTTNYGGTSTLRVDGWQDDAALLKWDLSSIPAGSTIQSVSLTLNVSDPTRSTYEIYQLKRDWSETTSTWRQAASGVNWQTAGAKGTLDRGSTVLGTVTASSVGPATIKLNSAGLAVVQSWINNPSSNYGFVIQDYSATDGLSFSSSNHSNPAVRPTLTVSYSSGDTTTPPPTGTTNQAPIVDAGASQSVPVSGTVNLNGTVTDDGLPNPPSAVTTTWSKVSGPGTVTFGNAAAVDTTARFSTAGTYVLQLLANDGSLKTSDTVTITITDSTTPQPVQGFFVSPTGSSKGDGSAAKPWDLQTALSQPAAVKPGSTIWLRGGTYRGEFTSNLVGTANAPITVAAYPGEHVIIDTYKPGNTENPLFKVMGDYTNFQGFEIMSSDPSSRVTSQKGSHPTNINRGGLYDYGDYNKFINLVVHDLNTGIGLWSAGKGGEVYGTIIYNNGWIGPDRTHGHGIYTQNKDGTKRIADNIIFNQFDYGFHAYGSQEAYLQNYLLEGNTLFNNGAGTGAGYERQPDILIGGAVPSSNITLKENYTYQNGFDGVVRLGYSQVNKDLTLKDNYFVSDLQLRTGWTSINASGNTVVGKSYGVVEMDVPPGVSPSSYQWNSNRYYTTANSPFNYEGAAKTWSQWRSTTKLDSSSTFQNSLPTQDKVFVQPNEYEAGRANITVYNWDRNGTASIDLSSVLTVGAKYEIHNVMNLFGTPTISGVYDGKPITLPMKAVAGPRPIGYSGPTPVGTGSDFGVFVVTSSSMAGAAVAAQTVAAPAMAEATPMAVADAPGMNAAPSLAPTSVEDTSYAQESAVSPATVAPTAVTDPAVPEAAPVEVASDTPSVNRLSSLASVTAEDTAQVQATEVSPTVTTSVVAETTPEAVTSTRSMDSTSSPISEVIDDTVQVQDFGVPPTDAASATSESVPLEVTSSTPNQDSTSSSTPSGIEPTPTGQETADSGTTADRTPTGPTREWTREASRFHRLLRDGMPSHWSPRHEIAESIDAHGADSVHAERIREQLDQLHDRVDTPEEREALATQIRDRLTEIKTTVTQAIDEALLDLQDDTTSLKDDLHELFGKLAELRPWIGRRV